MVTNFAESIFPGPPATCKDFGSRSLCGIWLPFIEIRALNCVNSVWRGHRKKDRKGENDNDREEGIDVSIKSSF